MIQHFLANIFLMTTLFDLTVIYKHANIYHTNTYKLRNSNLVHKYKVLPYLQPYTKIDVHV